MRQLAALATSPEYRRDVSVRAEYQRASAAMQRTSLAMVRWYDGMDLYHELWPSLSLIVSGADTRGYYCEPATRTILVPCDWQPVELVQFVREAFRKQLRAALKQMHAARLQRQRGPME